MQTLLSERALPSALTVDVQSGRVGVLADLVGGHALVVAAVLGPHGGHVQVADHVVVHRHVLPHHKPGR